MARSVVNHSTRVPRYLHLALKCQAAKAGMSVVDLTTLALKGATRSMKVTMKSRPDKSDFMCHSCLVSPELHRAVKAAAVSIGCSTELLTMAAIEKALDKLNPDWRLDCQPPNSSRKPVFYEPTTKRVRRKSSSRTASRAPGERVQRGTSAAKTRA